MEHLKKISTPIEYEITRVIAEGGMGAVYEAVQHGVDDFKKQVAIKLILEKYSAIPEFRSNFVGEAKLVADLIHSNIVQTYHLGMADMHYFMVMEYVNGINLEDFFVWHLERKEKIPVDMSVFLVSRICRGLAYAHEKKDKEGRPLNIVHRDVSPRNVMLGFEGDVKITDWGIAKARDLMYNKEGEVIAGKDEYLSPEQARKEVTDPRADIFTCGVVLSELLLGYNIFEGETPEETHKNIKRCDLPDFTKLDKRIDKKLNKILHKALQPYRDNRYPTTREMLTELEVYIYSGGYGPTNETLAEYLANMFNTQSADAVKKWRKGVKQTKINPGML